jgi:hypothetical protein
MGEKDQLLAPPETRQGRPYKGGGVCSTCEATAPKLPDLYNECSGVTPKDMSEVDLNKVPIVELDKDGGVLTAFMVGDNYFETSTVSSSASTPLRTRRSTRMWCAFA